MFSSAFVNSLYIWSTIILGLITFNKWFNAPGNSMLFERKSNYLAPLIYCVLFTLIVGLRGSDAGFVDTINYLYQYYMVPADMNFAEGFVNFEEEWGWMTLIMIFRRLHLDVNAFFLFVDACYVFLMYWAIVKLLPRHQWTALLFVVSSFSFLTYSYNGIRNGMACSLCILAFAYMIDRDKRSLIIAIILSLAAVSIHRSTFLPIVCAFAAMFIVRDPRMAMKWWLFSIVISLVAGSTVQFFFAGLGFDDRMTDYAGELVEDQESAWRFSQTGFRFDFLLYSAMPIVLGYYLIYKRRIRDARYELLLNTYILANSFWVMVIRAAYSNRFAYLSWFLYPFVIAYPLLNICFTERQDRFVARVLLAYIGFTAFMQLFY